MANVDYRHYLINSDDFYDTIKDLIKTSNADDYSLISFDFDNFNYINDLFGYEIGNLTLRNTAMFFEANLEDGEYFTKLHADHFIFIIKNHDQLGTPRCTTQRLYYLFGDRKFIKDTLPSYYNLVCCGGIVSISDKSENLPALLDKANFARKKTKGNHTNTFLAYDPKMKEELKWQKMITVLMDSALDENEFEMYLQPLTLIKSGHLVGAEALVRWNSKKYGMIYPDKFIPILERNGFIKKLDFFMLGEACKFIKKCETEKKPITPISVNFSKAHISSPTFAQRVYATVSSFEISPKLIELEITENAMAENFDSLLKVITDLKSYGFRVALDDFGSAYSSLNHLKKLPFDVVKIDKEFISNDENVDRSRIIVAKIVELVKSLRMVSVMEGVETGEQVDFLTKLGCDIGQGYHYARPMPTIKFLEYLDAHTTALSYDGLSLFNSSSNMMFKDTIAKEFQMDNWELHVLGKNIDMGLMKGYLDGEVTVQYVNDKALEYLGYTRQEFADIFQNSITAFTHPDDIANIISYVDFFVKSGMPVSFKSRTIRKDGKIITLQGKASCVIDPVGRPIGLYAFRDVTDEMEKTEGLESSLREKIQKLEEVIDVERANREALRLSEERYKLLMEMSEDIMFEWDFAKDIVKLSDKFFSVYGLDTLLENVSVSENILSYIHPDDVTTFKDWVDNTYQKSGITEVEFRIEKTNGHYVWFKARTIAILGERNIPLKAIGLFTNINKQKTEFNELAKKAQLDPLTKLFNKEEARRLIETHVLSETEQMGAFCMVDLDNFKSINDNLGHQFGDMVLKETAKKILSIFRSSDIVGRLGGDEFVIYMSNPKDIEIVLARVTTLINNLHNTYIGKNAEYTLSASVGVALFPDNGICFDDLYRNADIALYQSKKVGKNTISLYQSNAKNSLDMTMPLNPSQKLPMRMLSTFYENDFIYNVFELLYETKELKTTIEKVLELVGSRFMVDRVYIIEATEDKNHLNNTFEWCNTGISPEMDTLQNLPMSLYEGYWNAFNDDGFLICDEIKNMDEVTYATLKRQDIKSLLQCLMYDNDKKVGIIGFDICSGSREWKENEVAILAYLSKVLTTFLIKNRAIQQLFDSMKNHVKMIENLNGYVYVIDDSHEIIYVNSATKLVGIDVGQKCYKAAFGTDSPCENCPAKQMTDEKPYASMDIYSTTLKTWINSAASRLQWSSNKQATLICCTDITKYKNSKLN